MYEWHTDILKWGGHYGNSYYAMRVDYPNTTHATRTHATHTAAHMNINGENFMVLCGAVWYDGQCVRAALYGLPKAITEVCAIILKCKNVVVVVVVIGGR